jgi:hypothetical protein
MRSAGDATGTTAEVRLDQGKATSSSAASSAILGFRLPGIRSGRHLLCRRPKSATMALAGSGIWRMSVKLTGIGQAV